VADNFAWTHEVPTSRKTAVPPLSPLTLSPTTRGLRTTTESPATANTRTSCTVRDRPGRHAHPPPKSLRGVHGTPLNGVWSTGGSLVRDPVKRRCEDSISPTSSRTGGHSRSRRHWVAVSPGSTSADTAHQVSQDQDILEPRTSQAEWSQGR
jgi:hypothetical protein